MKNIPVKKITYTYIGFGETDSTQKEQVMSISYIPIHSYMPETYDSIIVLDVTNGAYATNKIYHYNALFHIDEFGYGSPLYTLYSVPTETSGDNTTTVPKVIYDHGRYSVTMGTEDANLIAVVDKLNNQSEALNYACESIEAVSNILNDRGAAIGIQNSSNATSLMSNLGISINAMKEKIDVELIPITDDVQDGGNMDMNPDNL